MLVTLFGIVTLVNLEQPENANPPTLMTLLGIVALVRVELFWNALVPMLVTVRLLIVLGMVQRTTPGSGESGDDKATVTVRSRGILNIRQLRLRCGGKRQ